MVECPVCGKWLKHIFALYGHIRLKGDELHRIYFETHKMQNPKIGSTDIENQFNELKSLLKQQNDNLDKKYDLILSIMNKLIEILEKYQNPPAIIIKQQELESKQPEVKIEKILTVAELEKQYGSFDKALESLNYWKIIEIIDKDSNLNSLKRVELKDKALSVRLGF